MSNEYIEVKYFDSQRQEITNGEWLYVIKEQALALLSCIVESKKRFSHLDETKYYEQVSQGDDPFALAGLEIEEFVIFLIHQCEVEYISYGLTLINLKEIFEMATSLQEAYNYIGDHQTIADMGQRFQILEEIKNLFVGNNP